MDVRALVLTAVIALAACNRLPRDSSAREQAMAMTGADPDDGPWRDALPDSAFVGRSALTDCILADH